MKIVVMVMDMHIHRFYSNSCYGNIHAVARVIVAMVMYILLLSMSMYVYGTAHMSMVTYELFL